MGKYAAHAKTIVGKVIDKRNYYSTCHIQLEAEIGEEKTIGIGSFGLNYYIIPISDVIDVIFQAYRKAAENE